MKQIRNFKFSHITSEGMSVGICEGFLEKKIPKGVSVSIHGEISKAVRGRFARGDFFYLFNSNCVSC